MSTCTLKGTLTDITGAATAGQVVIELQNYASQPPVISGSDVIAATQITVQAASNGTWSTTLLLNSSITPANTFYKIALSPAGSTAPAIVAGYSFNTTGTFDLSNLTPMVVIPSAATLVYGQTGPTGPTGATGAAGAAGSNGTNGTNGSNGAPGTSNVPWLDVQAYGAVPKISSQINATTTVTATSGSPNIAVGSALPFFTDGQGVAIWKAGAATTQSTPSAPAVTSPWISGSQTITYKIVGVDKQGGLTAASSSATVTTAPNVFSPSPAVISSISLTSDVVTVNFNTPLNTTVAAGMTIHIVGVMGSGVSWNGIWTIASAPTTQQITYALTASNGTGTVSSASTGRISNTQIITAISRASTGVITITTAEPHNYNEASGRMPTTLIVENVSPADLCGHYVCSGTPTSTTLTCYSGNQVAVTGVLQTNNTSTPVHPALNCSTVTVWEATVVACPALSGTTTQYYIYSDNANPGGTLELIGKSNYGESHFIDWGPYYGGGFLAPAYVPTTPPSSAQHQVFSTTILSGGTTTSLVLADNVPNGVTGGTIMYDDAPALRAAIAALPPASDDGGGAILLSPPLTNGSVPLAGYIVNSPLTIPSQVNLIMANAVIANETIYFGNGSELLGSPCAQTNQFPSFAFAARPGFYGIASPMVQVGSFANANMAGFVCDGVSFNQTDGNINGQYGLSIWGGFYVKIHNSTFVSNNDAAGGTNVPILLNGNTVDVDICGLTVEGSSVYGDQQPVGQSCFGPVIGNLVMRSSDNPVNSFSPARMLVHGINEWSGRGIAIDGQYENEPTYSFKFDWIWCQAPTTPLVSFIGHLKAFQIEINECVNDSEPAAILANLSPTMLDVTITRNEIDSISPLVTGNPIIGLQVNGYQSQVVGHTLNTDTRFYNSGNIGSVVANPPQTVLVVENTARSLGIDGVIFAPVAPSFASVSASASGAGTFAAGTWMVSVSFVGYEGGESSISTEVPVTVNGSQGIAVSWTAPSGFKGAYIYTRLPANGPQGNRSSTIYTSSPQTLTATGSNLAATPFLDGTGLPLINGAGIFTQQLCITNGGAPSTSTSAGIPGQIAWDATHVYVCVAANTWVRATLATF